MPLAIPIVLASVIGGGASIGSALINKSASKGSSSSSGALLPPGMDQTALKGLIDKQTGIADWFNTEGKSTLAQGRSELAGPMDFYRSLLGGDRTKLMETLAPEVAAINAQFKAPLKEATLTGKGSALVPDMEASRQSAISNLFFKERPEAADKLSAISQGLMSLGTQQVGAGGSILGQAAGETLDYNQLIRSLQASTRNDQSNVLGSLGASLGPILAQVLSSTGGSKGPATPGPPPIAMPPIDLGAIMASMSGAPELKAGWLSGTGGKR